MTQHRPDQAEREAQRILSRVADQADAFAAPRPKPEDEWAEDDWAERWGKRIGAILGPLLLALAAFWLIRQLFSSAPAP